MNNYEMNEKIGKLLGYTVKQIGGWYVLFNNGTTIINNKKLAMTCTIADIAEIFPNWSGDFNLCIRDLQIEGHNVQYYKSGYGSIVTYENEITGGKTSFAANMMIPALACKAFLSMNGIE